MRPILELNFCSIYKQKSNVMYNKIHILYNSFTYPPSSALATDEANSVTLHPKSIQTTHNYAQKYLQPQKKITPGELPDTTLTHQKSAMHCVNAFQHLTVVDSYSW
jgi:hypothetical protein